MEDADEAIVRKIVFVEDFLKVDKRDGALLRADTKRIFDESGTI